jgi:hypothetical protein
MDQPELYIYYTFEHLKRRITNIKTFKKFLYL